MSSRRPRKHWGCDVLSNNGDSFSFCETDGVGLNRHCFDSSFLWKERRQRNFRPLIVAVIANGAGLATLLSRGCLTGAVWRSSDSLLRLPRPSSSIGTSPIQDISNLLFTARSFFVPLSFQRKREMKSCRRRPALNGCCSFERVAVAIPPSPAVVQPNQLPCTGKKFLCPDFFSKKAGNKMDAVVVCPHALLFNRISRRCRLALTGRCSTG